MADGVTNSVSGYILDNDMKVMVDCSCGCGARFPRYKARLNTSGNDYVSHEHAGAHRAKVYLEDMCGPFLGIVTEYLETLAARDYKSLATARTTICPFILFLNERGILDLERVRSKTITEFLMWSDEVDYKNAAHNISGLAGFFKWAICYGYRRSTCPVVPRWHGNKRPHYLPRPYSAEEMAFIWSLATDRGNSRLRAVVAIGEEAGLRLGEICRLRMQDVDLVGQRLWVRIPNKTDTEGWALFSDKSAHYIPIWLLDRDADCGHDSLFHNSMGGPLLPETLHRECCRTFCRTYGGKEIHLEGLDQWSTHRLRHTMASNLASGGASISTIMAAGRWKSESSMMGYTKNDEQRARHDYDIAMSRVNEQANSPISTRTLSLQEFLAQHREGQ